MTRLEYRYGEAGRKILAMCTSLATMQRRRTLSTAVPASLPSGACSNTFCTPWSCAWCFSKKDARISCTRNSLLPTRYSKSTSGPHSGTPTRETPPLGSLLMPHCCRFLSLNLAPVCLRSIHKICTTWDASNRGTLKEISSTYSPERQCELVLKKNL